MASSHAKLFEPLKLAGQTVRNRISLAPLTRQMAAADGTPTDEMAAYYARRARGGFGMIITEGTYEDDALNCRAYLSQPGIANATARCRLEEVGRRHSCARCDRDPATDARRPRQRSALPRRRYRGGQRQRHPESRLDALYRQRL